jgi:nucleoside-diphosphate-sugar epimerase
MRSDFSGPVNIGSDEMISINDLAKMVINISNKKIKINNIPGPTGVRGRNSENSLFEEKLGWRVSDSLEDGIKKTYPWIVQQVEEHGDFDKDV